MKMVLVACEESQAVTIELRKMGIEAYSCDIQECSGEHPEWHIKGDVTEYLNGRKAFITQDGKGHFMYNRWDMILAFPPCTHLAVSGASSFEKKRADGRQLDGIQLFANCLEADCDLIAVENPVNIIGGAYIKKWFPWFDYLPNCNQKIQPWMFGDKVGKTTCLWLKGLPPLVGWVNEEPPKDWVYFTDRNGKVTRQEMWYYKTRCVPHSERGKMASKTFPGVAKAMAEQWGGYLLSKG